jgi:dTDP-4-dehydrorhamnose reductase
MKIPYANLSGDSGITNYEIVGSSIIIEFVHRNYRYVYNTTKPGPEHVKTMMNLAKQGKGLATYISQHVGPTYARRIPI